MTSSQERHIELLPRLNKMPETKRNRILKQATEYIPTFRKSQPTSGMQPHEVFR